VPRVVTDAGSVGWGHLLIRKCDASHLKRARAKILCVILWQRLSAMRCLCAPRSPRWHQASRATNRRARCCTVRPALLRTDGPTGQFMNTAGADDVRAPPCRISAAVFVCVPLRQVSGRGKSRMIVPRPSADGSQRENYDVISQAPQALFGQRSGRWWSHGHITFRPDPQGVLLRSPLVDRRARASLQRAPAARRR
jgi:hypothetical protein